MIRIDVIFNYRDASENSGWICPKVQVNFATNILLRGSSLKLQKVSDIFLSPVRKDLNPRTCCMPGIWLVGAGFIYLFFCLLVKLEVLVWKILMESSILSRKTRWASTAIPETQLRVQQHQEVTTTLQKDDHFWQKKKVQIKQTHNCVVFCCWQRLSEEWRIIKMLVIVLFIDSNLITSCLYCQCIFPHRG